MRTILSVGSRVGRLTIMAVGDIVIRGGSRRPTWNCLCDCGNERIVLDQHLKAAIRDPKQGTQSCGCLWLNHGHNTNQKPTPEYEAWNGARKRCADLGNPNYGGRGIIMCERWNDFNLFLLDMGMRPSQSHSIDRINVDGNYEPSNCRWATPNEQAWNRRNVTLYEFNGDRVPIGEVARRINISRDEARSLERKGKLPATRIIP